MPVFEAISQSRLWNPESDTSKQFHPDDLEEKKFTGSKKKQKKIRIISVCTPRPPVRYAPPVTEYLSVHGKS